MGNVRQDKWFPTPALLGKDSDVIGNEGYALTVGGEVESDKSKGKKY